MKQMTKNSIRAGRGFTLLELLVVITILAILAAVAVPRIMDNPDKARVVKVKQDLRAFESALNQYKLDNFNYPSTDQGLEALVSQPSGSPEAKNWKSGGYMTKLVKDPWGNDYVYLSPGLKGEIDIYSYGADGRPGGEGMSADLGNWE